MKKVKDWDKILENYSSGCESDEYDEPNIVSLRKHGPKLLELMSNALDKKNVPQEHSRAIDKATTNRTSEPVTDAFKEVQKEVGEAIIKKFSKKQPQPPK